MKESSFSLLHGLSNARLIEKWLLHFRNSSLLAKDVCNSIQIYRDAFLRWDLVNWVANRDVWVRVFLLEHRPWVRSVWAWAFLFAFTSSTMATRCVFNHWKTRMMILDCFWILINSSVFFDSTIIALEILLMHKYKAWMNHEIWWLPDFFGLNFLLPFLAIILGLGFGGIMLPR